MNRTQMMTELNKVLQTLYINSNQDPLGTERPPDFLVLKYSHSLPSARNALGSWQYWSVQIYIDGNSILKIDDIYAQVKLMLKQMDVEITDADSGDYFDNVISKYRNVIEFRKPKGDL